MNIALIKTQVTDDLLSAPGKGLCDTQLGVGGYLYDLRRFKQAVTHYNTSVLSVLYDKKNAGKKVAEYIDTIDFAGCTGDCQHSFARKLGPEVNLISKRPYRSPTIISRMLYLVVG